MLAELPLVGGGGEPVDLWRTITSHGVVELPPTRVDVGGRALEATVPVDGAQPRMLRIAEGRAGWATVTVIGDPPDGRERERIVAIVRHILRLDDDLSPFYAVAATDPDLAWATRGAGRLVRSATVFEDFVKTICTTNCSWSATEWMVCELVEQLVK